MNVTTIDASHDESRSDYRKAVLKEPRVQRARAMLVTVVMVVTFIAATILTMSSVSRQVASPSQVNAYLLWLALVSPAFVMGPLVWVPVGRWFASKELNERHAKKQCIWCRYPRPGSVHDPCPECGRISVLRP